MSWNTNNIGWQGASVWEGFENIEAKKGKNEYLPVDIDSVMTVEELKVVQSMKNPGQNVFVAVLSMQDENGTKKSYDWVAKMTERAYLIAIKSLVCAINPEADASHFGADVMNHITGAEQPCKGLQVRVKTEEIETKKGNKFTKVHWFSV